MSGDDHGTTGELDLDAIEARAVRAGHTMHVPLVQQVTGQDVPALVAEVRRLRALLENPVGAGLCPHGWAPERCPSGCAPKYVPYDPRRP